MACTKVCMKTSELHETMSEKERNEIKFGV